MANIQSSLFDVAYDLSAEADKRLQAWGQAIRLAPASPRILEAVDIFFSPQLSPEIGSKAMEALQAARVDGLAPKLLIARRKLASLAGSVIRLLLSRADSTTALLDAIEQGQLQFSDLQLDQRQALVNHPDRALARRAAN